MQLTGRKRWLACLMAVAMLWSAWGLPAAVSASENNHVVISGKLDASKAGKTVQLLIMPESADPNNIQSREIEYNDTFEVAEDGSYRYEFDYTSSLDGYKLLLTQGGEDIHQSVTQAAIVGEGSSVETGETVQLSGADLSVLTADVEALYRSERVGSKLILTFYDDQAKLIDMMVSADKAVSESSGLDLSAGVAPGAVTMMQFMIGSAQKPLEFFELRPVEKKSIKILAIGNSFSDNAVTYLPYFAEADDMDLTVANLYIGGCSLQMHWEKASTDAADYAYKKAGEASQKSTMKDALLDEEWDYITFQQASHYSADWSTYEPYLSQLSAYVKQYAPQAQQLIHQTWAYKDTCSRLKDELGFNTPDEMFAGLKDAYDKAADTLDAKILPSGQAFVYTLSKRPQMNLYAGDGYHAGPMGCYAAGAVWYEALTGRQILLNTYCPANFSIDEEYTLKDSVHKAVLEYGWGK